MQRLNLPVLQGRGGRQDLSAAFNLRQPRQEDQNTAALRLVEGVLLDGAQHLLRQGFVRPWWLVVGVHRVTAARAFQHLCFGQPFPQIG